jgi:hypothetical protein
MNTKQFRPVLADELLDTECTPLYTSKLNILDPDPAPEGGFSFTAATPAIFPSQPLI